MSNFSKLGIVVTSLSSLLFLALLAEIIYLLFLRRRRPTPTTIVHDLGLAAEDADHPSHHCLSKDLLHFLRRKKRTRIEPTGGSTPTAGAETDPSPSSQDVNVEISELMKLHGIHGPSRILFTIKEEETDDMGLSSERSSVTGRKGAVDRCGSSIGDSPAEGFETPFESPCGSSRYYSPSPSPLRFER